MCQIFCTIQEVWSRLGVARKTELTRKVEKRIHRGKASPALMTLEPAEIHGFLGNEAESVKSPITGCMRKPRIAKGGDRPSLMRPWRNWWKEVTTWK